MSPPTLPVHLARLALAYEIVATNILREAGLLQPDAARAWARFWVAHDEPSVSQQAMRELTRVLVGERWQVAQVAQVFCRLAEVEVQCRGQAAASNGVLITPLRSSLLIDLLAGYEGALLTEQALAQQVQVSQPQSRTAALEQAAKALATATDYHGAGPGLVRLERGEPSDALVRLSQQATWLALDLAQAALRQSDGSKAVREGEDVPTPRVAA